MPGPLDILVPYWGDPALMRLTVQSVLDQTSPHWRLTVVDDAYPDPQVTDWLRGLSDPRVRALRNETNQGITANYRRCRDLATQDFVVFLGSDDLLRPRYVERVLQDLAAFPDADMVQPGVRVIDETGSPARSLVDSVKQRLLAPDPDAPVELGGERLAASLLEGNWLYWPSLVFRRERLLENDFREGFPIIQDFALIIDLIAGGSTLVVDPRESFVYRRHGGSASATTLEDGSRFEAERRYYAIAAAQMRDLGWRRAQRAARARLTSRAYAVTLLPDALLRRRWQAVRQLGRHALSR